MTALQKRNDQQIMALEMVAAFFGVSSFADEVRNKTVHLWVDNTSGEAALRNGSSKAKDHNALCHQMRLYAATLNATLILHRVPTKENISDLPSREDYAALLAYGAVRVSPSHPPISDFDSFVPASPSRSVAPPPQKRESRRSQLRSRSASRRRRYRVSRESI